MLLSRGWRLLRYSFFTSISFRIFSLLVRHSLYFSASLGVGIQLLPQLQRPLSFGSQPHQAPEEALPLRITSRFTSSP